MSQSQVQTQTQTTTKPRTPITVTKSTSRSSIPPSVSTLTDAFSTDPMYTYLFNHISPSQRHTPRRKLFHLIATGSYLNNAIFYEASSGTANGDPEFQCVALIMPPGKNFDNLGVSGWLRFIYEGVFGLLWQAGIAPFRRAMSEYGPKTEAAKAKVFAPGEDYYYINNVATRSEHRGKGLCPALLKDLQVTAQEKGKPIWLEASNEGARAVYRKVGFVDADAKLVIGKGVCDATGEMASGERAVGVEFFPMVWWPRGYVRGLDRKGN